MEHFYKSVDICNHNEFLILFAVPFCPVGEPNTRILSLQGILSDLFPGVVLPEHDYGTLQTFIYQSLVDHGYQPLDCVIKKVIQLYETMIVRHGVMLVGPTGGGKTTIYQVRLGLMYSLKC